MLAAGHQPHAEAGAVEDEPGHGNGGDGHKQKVVQSQGAHLEGEVGAVQHRIGVGGVGDLGRVRAVDPLGDDHCHGGCQQVQGRATNGLVGLEVDGREGKERRVGRACRAGGDDGQQNADGNRNPGGIENVDHHDAHQAANDHDTLQGDVNDAGAFGEHAAHSHQGQDSRVQQSVF